MEDAFGARFLAPPARHAKENELNELRKILAKRFSGCKFQIDGSSKKYHFPKCIVCNRKLEQKVVEYSNTLRNSYKIQGIETGAERVVMSYLSKKNDDAIDIPMDIFNSCRIYVNNSTENFENCLFLRTYDPGLVIVLPGDNFNTTDWPNGVAV